MQNSQLTAYGLRLNVICFDVPYPADYGGAIEEFYKIKTLHQLGVKIQLHCFVYGDRKEQKELNKYCEKIFYYERNRSLGNLFSRVPFIVKTRMHHQLLENLLSNDYPILFDATHTTGFLNHPELQSRTKLVRLHNIEWIYYRVLFDTAFTPKEKLFFFTEYKKLREYDKMLVNAETISCLSQSDHEYYIEKFPDKKITLEYVFHENVRMECKTGKGDYILYHGNLSLTDNYQLMMELVSNELKDCKHKIIIAGKNPDKSLVEYVRNKSNVVLVSSPSDTEMNDLIVNAHICLAVAKNSSGVKLKLINSLFRSRFVVSNENALHGSGLEDLCIVPETSENYLSVIDRLMETPFTANEIQKRRYLLTEKYDNLKNGQQILNAIFEL